MKKEELQVVEPVQEPASEEMEKKQASAVVSFVAGIITIFFERSLIFGLVFAIIALVNSKKAKGVEKTAYRSFRTIGKIFGIVGLIVEIYSMVSLVLTIIFMFLYLNIVLIVNILANLPAIMGA